MSQSSDGGDLPEDERRADPAAESETSNLGQPIESATVRILEQLIAASPSSELDAVAQRIWNACSADRINFDQAGKLIEAIEARRSGGVQRRSDAREMAPRSRRSYPTKRRPRDERRLQHRRRLAAAGPMPPALAAHFTTCQLASLMVVSDEVKDHGTCELTVGEIAKRARVGRRSAQNALRRGHQLEFLFVQTRRKRGAKNDPNIVTVIDASWREWIAHRARKKGHR